MLEINCDMQKMAELTQELKEYLAKAGQGVTSIDASKKAEQIEKASPQDQVENEADVLDLRKDVACNTSA